MRRSKQILVATVVLAWIGAILPSCLEPTQITLDIRTDVRCEQAKGISVSAGDQGSVQNAPPRLVSRDCLPNGVIGTLVVTPETSRDADVAFRIVMGVDVPVEECTPERRNKGCIEQRRLVSYVAHTPIELPIDMLLICLGVVCDPASTCAANGKCVPARVKPEDCRPPNRCYPGDTGANGGSDGGDGGPTTDGPPATDGPITDGPISSDAPTDTPISSDAPPDSPVVPDAPLDSPPDAPLDSPPDAPLDSPADAPFDAITPQDGAQVGDAAIQ